jgi:hypothetical protein
VPVPNVPKGARESQAFVRLLPQLLNTHAGKYVAIHDGQVIDSDLDDIALILRVHARIGYVPIHVGLATEDQTPIRVPHYHEYYAPTSAWPHACNSWRKGAYNMAAIQLAEDLWRHFVAMAKKKREKPELLAERVLRDYLLRKADEELLVRSESAAQRNGVTIPKAEGAGKERRRRAKQ